MLQRVQYPDHIEPLVQFIEETPQARSWTHAGEAARREPIQTMLTASALAVTRSSDLPPGHHGGPLHPLAGLYAISNLVDRLEGEDKFVPVLQHVALANKHINDPATGPFQLLEFAPLDAAGVERPRRPSSKAVWLRREPQGGPPVPSGSGRTSRRSRCSICSWTWRSPRTRWTTTTSCTRLSLGVGWNFIGHEHLPVLMRPAVRYVGALPGARRCPRVDALIEQHELMSRGAAAAYRGG